MLIAITYKTYTHPAGHGALARGRALAPALPQHHPSPNTARPRDWLPACCLAGTTAKAHQERTQGQIRTCGGDLYSPDGPGIYPRGYRRRDTVTFCYQFRRKTQILSTSIWAGSRFTYLLPDVMVLGTGSTPIVCHISGVSCYLPRSAPIFTHPLGYSAAFLARLRARDGPIPPGFRDSGSIRRPSEIDVLKSCGHL